MSRSIVLAHRACSSGCARSTFGVSHLNRSPKAPIHCTHFLHRRSKQRFVAKASSSDSDARDYKEQARLLTKLFYSTSDKETGTPPVRPSDEIPVHIPALPLWRVQWAIMPGMQELIHVHAPHYVHMFEGLFTQPRPWYFGHVYLPHGSESLGSKEFALKPGTKAPLVGVLMEVGKALRLSQGRLLIVATAVTRIKVINTIQEVPYSRADVEVHPDYEEVSSVTTGCAEATLMSLDGETDIQLAMQACEMVGKASAVAASSCWLHEYEMVVARQNQWDESEPREASNGAEQELLVQDLIGSGSRAVVPLPDGPVVGRWKIQDVAKRAEQKAEEAAETFDMDTFLTATGRRGPLALGSSMYGPTTITPDVGMDPNTWKDDDGDLMNAVIKLEEAVWRELDAVAALALKVHKTRLSMPLGLLQLRPPPEDLPNSQTSLGTSHSLTPKRLLKTEDLLFGTLDTLATLDATYDEEEMPESIPTTSMSQSVSPAAAVAEELAAAGSAAGAEALTVSAAAESSSASTVSAAAESSLSGAAELSALAAESSLSAAVAESSAAAASTESAAAAPAENSAITPPSRESEDAQTPAAPTTQAPLVLSTAAAAVAAAATAAINELNKERHPTEDSTTALSEDKQASNALSEDKQASEDSTNLTSASATTKASVVSEANPSATSSSSQTGSEGPSRNTALDIEDAAFVLDAVQAGGNAAMLAATDADVLSGKYDKMASEGLDLHADPNYPAYRRAQRLAYAVAATLLPDMGAERWQQLLETSCTAQRLKLALSWLRRKRNLYAALAAVQDLKKSS